MFSRDKYPFCLDLFCQGHGAPNENGHALALRCELVASEDVVVAILSHRTTGQGSTGFCPHDVILASLHLKCV